MTAPSSVRRGLRALGGLVAVAGMAAVVAGSALILSDESVLIVGRHPLEPQVLALVVAAASALACAGWACARRPGAPSPWERAVLVAVAVVALAGAVVLVPTGDVADALMVLVGSVAGIGLVVVACVAVFAVLLLWTEGRRGALRQAVRAIVAPLIGTVIVLAGALLILCAAWTPDATVVSTDGCVVLAREDSALLGPARSAVLLVAPRSSPIARYVATVPLRFGEPLGDADRVAMGSESRQLLLDACH